MLDSFTKKPYLVYVVGFVLSVILTLLAYTTVVAGAFSYQATVAWILVFAVVQLFVQLIFFLHLGREAKPRWRIVVLAFGILVVAILVFGSLWIMDNLNYSMMHSPDAADHYMHRESGF